MGFETIRAKEAIQVTFKNQVTRDELIQSLDSILNHYGCAGCGLNGMESINLLADPDPITSDLRLQLIDKFESVIDVRSIGTPQQQFNVGFQR